MKILLVTQYFWPESFIINDLVKILATQGHEVFVLTGKPNYPDGKVMAGYSQHGCQEEGFVSGVRIFRAPLRPRGSAGAKGLLLNYLSFVWNGIRYYPKAIRGNEFDIILVFCLSPITSAIPAILLKRRLKKHLAVWVQDLWPESLSATGFIRNPFLLRMVGLMVKAIYRSADTLLVQSRAFQEPVANYANADKIVYYPNSYQDVSQASAESILSDELLRLLDRSFCIVFAGNLGTAQSVETIVAAARKLQHLADCKLVLVGSGSMLSWIRKEQRDGRLDNVVLPGRFPSSQMWQFFSRAQGLLVTLKRDPIFSYTVPSKVQAYLAAGRPIIASIDGEGARVIAEARAGLTCPAGDVDALAAAIETLYKMSPCEREKMGNAGREYFLANFEMKTQATKLIKILEERMMQCDEAST